MPDDDDDDAPPPPPHSAPPPPPAPPAAKPPLLEYPSRPTESDLDTESWTQIGRAMAKVFGVLLGLFVIGSLLCGVLPRGCG